MSEKSRMPQELRDIWTDAYKLHAALIGMENTIQDWKRAYHGAQQIYEKHGMHPLALQLLAAVFNYQEKALVSAEKEREP